MGTPSVTKSSSAATEQQYFEAVDATAVQVFSGRGNLYGFIVEENSGSDVFIQFFDAASTGDVTVGTNAVFTKRIPATGTLGKDVNDSPYRFFALGCVIAVTTTRTGNTDPATAATVETWSWDK